MYPDRPDRDTFVARSGYITARDQSMVQSGVTEGGKNICQFSLPGMKTKRCGYMAGNRSRLSKH